MHLAGAGANESERGTSEPDAKKNLVRCLALAAGVASLPEPNHGRLLPIASRSLYAVTFYEAFCRLKLALLESAANRAFLKKGAPKTFVLLFVRKSFSL